VVNNSGFTKSFYFFSQPPSLLSGSPAIFSNSLGSRGIGNGLSTTLTYIVEYGYWISQGEAVTIGATFSADGGVSAALGTTEEFTYADNIKYKDLVLGTPVIGGPTAALTGIVNNFNAKAPFILGNPCIMGISVNVGSGPTPLATMDVSSQPGSTISMTPVVTLYAATGSYVAGAVVDWSVSNKSPPVNITDLTKFPSGQAKITIKADGTWTGPEAF